MATPDPGPPPQLAFPAAPACHADHEGATRLYRALRAAAEEDGGALLVALGAQARPTDAPLVFQLRRTSPIVLLRVSPAPSGEAWPARVRSEHRSPLLRNYALPGRAPRLELGVADSSAAAAALRDSLGAAWTVASLGYHMRSRRAASATLSSLYLYGGVLLLQLGECPVLFPRTHTPLSSWFANRCPSAMPNPARTTVRTRTRCRGPWPDTTARWGGARAPQAA